MQDISASGVTVFLILSVGTVYFVLLLRARLKVNVRQENNYTRFERFEYKMVYPTDLYSCYSDADNGKWVLTDYEALSRKITQSPSMVFTGGIPKPDFGIRYSLKLDRESKTIYVALGNDSYDWNSIGSPYKAPED